MWVQTDCLYIEIIPDWNWWYNVVALDETWNVSYYNEPKAYLNSITKNWTGQVTTDPSDKNLVKKIQITPETDISVKINLTPAWNWNMTIPIKSWNTYTFNVPYDHKFDNIDILTAASSTSDILITLSN